MPHVSSFSELAHILRNKKDLEVERKILQDASHLGTAINRLAACESLNATAANSDHNGAMSNAIDFSDVFTTPQVLYFYLPAAIGSASSGDIAQACALRPAFRLQVHRPRTWPSLPLHRRVSAHRRPQSGNDPANRPQHEHRRHPGQPDACRSEDAGREPHSHGLRKHPLQTDLRRIGPHRAAAHRPILRRDPGL